MLLEFELISKTFRPDRLVWQMRDGSTLWLFARNDPLLRAIFRLIAITTPWSLATRACTTADMTRQVDQCQLPNPHESTSTGDAEQWPSAQAHLPGLRSLHDQLAKETVGNPTIQHLPTPVNRGA
jgi:hypothetical protein